jgi:hypothetical protein
MADEPDSKEGRVGFAMQATAGCSTGGAIMPVEINAGPDLPGAPPPVRPLRLLTEEELRMVRGGGPGVSSGFLAKDLGGTVPIPSGQNLALGLTKHLKEFVNGLPQGHEAISVEGAWIKKFIQVPIIKPADFKGFFHAIVEAFAKAGGRIKLNLTGLQAGIEKVTTWELRQILKSPKLFNMTDFYRNGVKLTGKALEEALAPWR